MNKIAVSNDGESPKFVGGRMIPPGETLLFEAHELPPEYREDAPETAADDEADPLAELIKLSIAKLALGLPDLSDDELLRLEALEQAKETPRQGALAKILQERLRRAETKAPGGLDSGDGTKKEGE